MKHRPAVDDAIVIVGVSVVVTPMKPTLTWFGAVPTVWITYGFAKAGVVQLLASHEPETMLAVTNGYVACVVRSTRFGWPQSNSWLPNVATL